MIYIKQKRYMRSEAALFTSKDTNEKSTKYHVTYSLVFNLMYSYSCNHVLAMQNIT